MYNNKSKTSAIITIVSGVLLVGFMIMIPFLRFDIEGSNGLAAFFITLIYILGWPLIYAGGIPYAVVALIFGIKMLKGQSRTELIAFNSKMLITSCVLLPFLVFGIVVCSGLIFQATLKVLSIIYTILISLAYIAGLVAQIATIILLKKSPDAEAPVSE